MADHHSLPPLRLAPRPSRGLLALAVAAHAAALLVLIPLSALGAGSRIALASLILASLGLTIWDRILRRAPWSVVAVDWNERGWQATFADGSVRPVQLLPSTYVAVGLVILHLRLSRLRRPVLLLTADSLPADQLRRLRMMLRLGLARGGDDAAADGADGDGARPQ